MENKQVQHKNRKDDIECYGKGFEALEGSLLAGKYKIGTFIDQGSFGSIYNVTDTSSHGAHIKK
jgi:hypothetical protein